MALFETVAGERPRHTDSSEGVKGDYLSGRGGVALRTLFVAMFVAISPETEEKTLAGIVKKLDAEFEGATDARFRL
jgi:hypothetical protein